MLLIKSGTADTARLTMNGASLVTSCNAADSVAVVYYENKTATDMQPRAHLSGLAPSCGGLPLTSPCAALPSEPARPGSFRCQWIVSGDQTFTSQPVSATAEAVLVGGGSILHGYKLYVECPQAPAALMRAILEKGLETGKETDVSLTLQFGTVTMPSPLYSILASLGRGEGGLETAAPQGKMHVFMTPGTHTFTVDTQLRNVHVMLVGGGGGALRGGAGCDPNCLQAGGGAGGLVHGIGVTIEPGTYTLVVGGGGGYGVGGSGRGSNGEDTTGFDKVAKGGGYGSVYPGTAASQGGSGGGGTNHGSNNFPGGASNQPSYTSGECTASCWKGYGSTGGSASRSCPYTGGGGGGAGGDGLDSFEDGKASGGIGMDMSTWFGTSVGDGGWFAGGGGGSVYGGDQSSDCKSRLAAYLVTGGSHGSAAGTYESLGGRGGGGKGSNGNGLDGMMTTGGGGGAGERTGDHSAGSHGGSGIIVISYPGVSPVPQPQGTAGGMLFAAPVGRMHVFMTPGTHTFTVVTQLRNVHVMLVGGGGGALRGGAGCDPNCLQAGGGAGGLVHGIGVTIEPGTYTLVVGGGGGYGVGGSGRGSNGEDTTGFDKVAKGGGYGSVYPGTAASQGGSGGGGTNHGSNNFPGGASNQPSYTSGECTASCWKGYGSTGGSASRSCPYTGGGGGGAGGDGLDSFEDGKASGGIGMDMSTWFGTSVGDGGWFAGGGGGSVYGGDQSSDCKSRLAAYLVTGGSHGSAAGTYESLGGRGGGGKGSNGNGLDGMMTTGGGGGAGERTGDHSAGSHGGSGIIIIAY